MKKDEASKIINDTLNGFMDSAEDLEAFAVWLDHNSYRYSLRNSILIRCQNMGAICCQQVNAWKKAGYRVKDDEFHNGMVVFVPKTKTMVDVDGDGKYEKELKLLTKEEKKKYKGGEFKARKKLCFGLGFTYDIAQTTVPVEEYNKFLSRGEKSVKHADAWNALKKCVTEKYGIPVYDGADEKKIHGSGLFGYCQTSADGKQEIHISPTMKDTQKLSVGGHEIGHALMHKARGKSVDQMEVEADIFSILVNTHYGVPIEDTRKRHLKDHFGKLEFKDTATKDKQLAAMVSDVLETYKKYIVDVDSMMKQ